MKSKTLIIVGLFLLSCTTNKTDEVKIVLDKSKVQEGETITARLYVEHNDSINPEFYIITNQDTASIPVDDNDNNCGVFKAVGRRLGNNEYNGFVEFVDKNNIEQKYTFTIKYSVIKAIK